MTITDPIRRALRTLFQFIAAGGLTAFINEVVAKIEDTRLTALILAGSLLLVSYAQNELEDHGTIPALLKAPASSGENPVPAAGRARDANGRFTAQSGQVSVGGLVVVLLLVLLILVATGRL